MKSRLDQQLLVLALAVITLGIGALWCVPDARAQTTPNIQPVLSANRLLFTVGVDRYFAPKGGDLERLGAVADTRLSANLSYGFKFISVGGGWAYFATSKDSQPFLAARLAVWRNGGLFR